ncbi:MAG: DUF3857 domain-containing protein [Pseudomonadota bacterium]
MTSASAAHAGDKVLYQPAPEWVTPAPAIDVAKVGADAPFVLLLDNQQRLQDGQVWNYVDTASRVASNQALTSLGTVQLPWQPAQGDLIIHRAEILRGTQRIDLVAGKDPFAILRREQNLAKRMLDGMLTATMAVPGLQVGDVLHFTFSITRKDPTLKGDMQSVAQLVFSPNRVGFARNRLIWPVGTEVKWRSYADNMNAQPVTVGKYRELTLTLPLPKPADRPNDAPLRFQPLPILEATTFADWGAVSRVMVPLYATTGLITPGSPLAGEVTRIRQASSDPLKRTALALQLVQDKIGYLLLGMDTGNYVPQAPALTWDTRYGDCKAKTLLLLALLHALEIEAEPVLASVKAGGLVTTRLPSAAAFDHVLVRATVAGQTLWLDGTDGGARLEDLADTPDFGAVLPVRAAGAEPLTIVQRPAARPGIVTVVDLDQSAGVGLPAPFAITITIRGATAELLRNAKAQGTEEQLEGMTTKVVGGYLGTDAIVATHALSFDAAAGTALLHATGIAYPEWKRKELRYRYGLDHSIAEIDFKPDRGRPAWRNIPVRTADPGVATLTMRIKLPRGGAGFVVEGADSFTDTLAGRRIERQLTRTGDGLTVVERQVETGAEIAVADIPAMRQKIAAAKVRLPFAVAPADYPQLWTQVADARRAGRLAPILAVYDARVAQKPEEADRYADRAWFHDKVYDRKAALADLDRAIALEPTVARYVDRSNIHADLGQSDKALADAAAALALDPGSDSAIGRLSYLQALAGKGDDAIALVQARIDADGEDKTDFLSARATLQSLTGDAAGAVATMDEAIAVKPREGNLFNTRCWIAGTDNIGLDQALKDCNRAIELEGNYAGYLDSRAMVYFRLGRMEDALVDLNTALELSPDQAGSLFMRAIVARRLGKGTTSAADLSAARLIDPEIDRDYKRWGIAP